MTRDTVAGESPRCCATTFSVTGRELRSGVPGTLPPRLPPAMPASLAHPPPAFKEAAARGWAGAASLAFITKPEKSTKKAVSEPLTRERGRCPCRDLAIEGEGTRSRDP